jgi:hypothetical protein
MTRAIAIKHQLIRSIFIKALFVGISTVLQTSHHFINQNKIFNWELKAQFPV